MNRLVLVTLALLAAATTACALDSGNGAEELSEVTTPVIEGAATVALVEKADPSPTITERPFQRYTSQEAIDAFIAAGLEAESPTPLEVDGHSPLPPIFVEALRFQMPSFGDRTGRVFRFESAADLQAIKAYYEAFTGSQASHVFVKDNLLLQVSASMPADAVEAYQDALNSLE